MEAIIARENTPAFTNKLRHKVHRVGLQLFRCHNKSTSTAVAIWEFQNPLRYNYVQSDTTV